MIHHHQTDEVLRALSQHQLIVFVGARGTGKTCLLEETSVNLEKSGISVLQLDAERANVASDLMTPIADRLSCGEDSLTATGVSPDMRLRVLVDNCDALHDKSWFPAVQDQWRGLLGEPVARGRIAFLLAGRPLFRRVAEGRGSPLLGIGTIIESRPLAIPEIDVQFSTSSDLAETARAKTGGHPQLTGRLLTAIDRDLANLKGRYVEFAQSQRRYVLQLIDDHGERARTVLADLLDAPREGLVAESALLARHFGGHGTLGEDTINDLAASGLIESADGFCRVTAEILRTDRELRQHLAAPQFAIISEPSFEYAEAASVLFTIENRLRQFVGSALGEVDDTWWPSRFPAKVVREVDQRRLGEANSPSPSSVDVHPVAYLHLGELVDSILEETNWEQVFRIRLGLSREALSQSAAAITAVRNKVAHNRPVTEDDLTVLRLAVGRLHL